MFSFIHISYLVFFKSPGRTCVLHSPSVAKWDPLIQHFKGLLLLFVLSIPLGEHKACTGGLGCELADLLLGYREGEGGDRGVCAGPEIREEQIMLEIASCSVCNQDQTGFQVWGGGVCV